MTCRRSEASAVTEVVAEKLARQAGKTRLTPPGIAATAAGNADANGEINVSWPNLLEDDGQTQYYGDSFNASFTIGDPNAYTETLSRSSVPPGDGDFYCRV